MFRKNSTVSSRKLSINQLETEVKRNFNSASLSAKTHYFVGECKVHTESLVKGGISLLRNVFSFSRGFKTMFVLQNIKSVKRKFSGQIDTKESTVDFNTNIDPDRIMKNYHLTSVPLNMFSPLLYYECSGWSRFKQK